jgi:HAD superfamily hydrolase (TIGR01509 family)
VPAPTPLVDALLFDFGNIVVDIDFHRAFDVWARAAGVPAADIVRRFAFNAAYEAHELGELEAAEYHAAVCQTLSIELSFDAFLAGWNAIFVQPREGMDTLLPALAATMPLYLFSNTNALHHAYWSAEYRDLLENFSGIFCSHQISARKPAAKAFRIVAEKIGLPPSRIAFFDDLPENVAGARTAGMAGFHITSLPELRDALRNLNIDRPDA